MREEIFGASIAWQAKRPVPFLDQGSLKNRFANFQPISSFSIFYSAFDLVFLRRPSPQQLSQFTYDDAYFRDFLTIDHDYSCLLFLAKHFQLFDRQFSIQVGLPSNLNFFLRFLKDLDRAFLHQGSQLVSDWELEVCDAHCLTLTC